MKKKFALLMTTLLCISFCACGKQYDQAMELMELVENQRYDEAHELLNQMAGEEGTLWVPDYSYQGNGDSDTTNDSFVADNMSTDDAPVISESSEPEGPKEIPIIGVELSATELNLETLETAALTAKVVPEDTTESFGSIKWSSSDESVVTVSYWDGTVKAVGNGTATITATVGDYVGTCMVTVSNPTIATVEELLSYEDFEQGVVYEIVADMDMNGQSFPENCGNVYGTIEGNGHTISGVKDKALFQSNQGTIRNLTVEVDIHVEQRETDTRVSVAGLVGYNGGTLENCVAKGSIFVACENMTVGGITSGSHGTVYRCGNEVDITLDGMLVNPLGIETTGGCGQVAGVSTSASSLTECYNTGDITILNCSSVNVGGLVYDQYEVLKDCYNTGNVQYENTKFDEYNGGIGYDLEHAENCLNFGNYLGGICYRTMGTYLVDCYYLESASLNGAIADSSQMDPNRVRVHGLSDAAALLQESYPTLDFENVWVMSEGGYPILRWQQ